MLLARSLGMLAGAIAVATVGLAAAAASPAGATRAGNTAAKSVPLAGSAIGPARDPAAAAIPAATAAATPGGGAVPLPRTAAAARNAVAAIPAGRTATSRSSSTVPPTRGTAASTSRTTSRSANTPATPGGTVATAASARSGTFAIAASSASAQDLRFLAAIHQGNLVEIEAGRVAQRKAASPVVRRLSAEMAADHVRLDAALRSVAGHLRVGLQPSPSTARRAQLAVVAANGGTAFDSAWLRWQIAEHRQMIAAIDAELAQGGNASIKDLARRSALVVRTHLLALEQALAGGTPHGVNAGTGGQAARLPAGTAQAALVLLAVAAAIVATSAVLFGPRRHRVA